VGKTLELSVLTSFLFRIVFNEVYEHIAVLQPSAKFADLVADLQHVTLPNSAHRCDFFWGWLRMIVQPPIPTLRGSCYRGCPYASIRSMFSGACTFSMKHIEAPIYAQGQRGMLAFGDSFGLFVVTLVQGGPDVLRMAELARLYLPTTGLSAGFDFASTTLLRGAVSFFCWRFAEEGGDQWRVGQILTTRGLSPIQSGTSGRHFVNLVRGN
jgi:hypothetical protein